MEEALLRVGGGAKALAPRSLMLRKPHISKGPVTAEEFRVCFQAMIEHGPGLEPLWTGRPIGIAVSGGPDSLALCVMLRKAFPVSDPQSPKLCALMVDHAMESIGVKEEPTLVKDYCTSSGIDFRLLRADWTDTPLDTLTQGKVLLRAREKRYELLLDAANQIGSGLVLLGHNLDDDIVTMLYRMARFSGNDGIAGMRQLTAVPVPGHPAAASVLLGRPLLGIEKERLRATVVSEGVRFTDDTSNTRTEYSRNLISQTLARLQEQDPERFSTDRLAMLLESFKRHQQTVHERVVGIMDRSVLLNRKQGTAVLVANSKDNLRDGPAWRRILTNISQYVSCRVTPPPTSAVHRIMQTMVDSAEEKLDQLDRREERLKIAYGKSYLASDMRNEKSQELAKEDGWRRFLPQLPSDRTGRPGSGMMVGGGCVVYPLARADAAIRIEAARKAGRHVDFGPAFLVMRERLRKDQIVQLRRTVRPGEEVLWDGRLFISYSPSTPDAGPRELDIQVSHILSEDANAFEKTAQRFGLHAARRAVQLYRSVTPAHMMYHGPLIRCPSIDANYMAMPLADAVAGAPSPLMSVKWQVRAAAESLLLAKFRCTP